VCEEFAERYPGGAEVELTMLFADIRGSTSLAETMSPMAFSKLINRFYQAAMDVLVRHEAVIDRLVGDEMIGYFLPGFAGLEHTRQAIQAAREIFKATGHGQPDGPWVPVGVGVHRWPSSGRLGLKDGDRHHCPGGCGEYGGAPGLAGQGRPDPAERAGLPGGRDGPGRAGAALAAP
jgi:hypothetical protein